MFKEYLLTFETISQKLKNKDQYIQGDVGVEIFETWYKAATQYAQSLDLNEGFQEFLEVTLSALNYLLASNVHGMLTNSSTDDFVIKALMENFRKIITICIIKPKFQSLVQPHEGKYSPIMEWLQKVAFPTLQEAILRNGVPRSNREEYLKTLTSLIELGNQVEGCHYELNLREILQIAIKPTTSQVLRTCALDLVLAYGKKHEDDVVLALAYTAQDSLTLEPIWKHGGIAKSNCLAVLLDRAEKAVQSQTQHEFLVELVFSIHTAIKFGYIHVPSYVEELLAILRVCDKSKNEYKEGGEGIGERNPEIIEVLNTILRECPDSIPILNFALNPLTLESLSMVEGLSFLYQEETWITFLLPFLNSQINLMQLQGISGKLLEQEVINFVREGARIFYLSKSRTPGLRLGTILFQTIIEGIRHGYIETERFPALSALICAYHFPEGSVGWLNYTLDPRICHNHKTTRAIYEIILRLLGVYNDADAPTSDFEQQEAVLNVVAQAGTTPAFNLLAELCKNNGIFMSEKEAMIRLSLESVQKAIGYLQTHRDEFMLNSVIEFLRSLTTIISPANAAFLFTLTLNAMFLLPQGNNTAYSDETLCKILQKVPNTVPLSLSVVEQALKFTGSNTRHALAEFLPAQCLLDRDFSVRAQALRVLANRYDLLPIHANALFAAISKETLDDAEVCDALAPTLASLAIVHSPSIPKCLSILIEAADRSRKNDPRNNPSKVVIQSLDRIVTEKSKVELMQFASSSEGLKLLQQLEKRSVKWSGFVKEMINKQIIKPLPVGGYTNGPATVEMKKENETLIKQMKTAMDHGAILDALRLCKQLSLTAPSLYESEVKPFLYSSIFPSIAAILPIPTLDKNGSLVFSESQLNEYERFISLMLEVQRLFFFEAEQALNIGTRISDLNYAMVQRFLANGEPQKAREWLAKNKIHDPRISVEIDRYEFHSTRRKSSLVIPKYTTSTTNGDNKLTPYK